VGGGCGSPRGQRPGQEREGGEIDVERLLSTKAVERVPGAVGVSRNERGHDPVDEERVQAVD
jgi:hypothetical protein